MYKKILLIVVLLFLTVSNKALADNYIKILPLGEKTEIALASSQNVPSETVKAADTALQAESHTSASPWHNFIVPGIAGILIVGGAVSYWFFLRKKLV